MKTQWKNLVGKTVLIRVNHREGNKKTLGELKEVSVMKVSESGVHIKVRVLNLLHIGDPLNWYHRNDIKLCEIL